MAYTLATSYVGESLLSGFDWFNGTDPSNGYVAYQSREDAEAQSIVSLDTDTNVVRLGVDSTNVFGEDEGRPSIRLESKEAFNHGLYIADFEHMPPSQCGLWPAFWTYGENWPAGGEVDIIEGANTAHNNIISAHTGAGCVLDPAGSSSTPAFSGEQRNDDCFVGDQNIGCGFNPPDSAMHTYGDSFNAIGGGVYAMQWDDEFIRVWHFARDEVPADIDAGNPDPSSWVLPQAVFGGSRCDVDGYFTDMSIVININFCGDYGDGNWDATCSDHAPTCSSYVANNPEAFANAYWDVKYIKAYTWDETAVTPEPTTTTTMTSFSTTFVTVGGESATPLPAQATFDATTPVAAVANPAEVDNHASLGCFDSTSSFSTFTVAEESDDMTIEHCVSKCGSAKYAGLSCGRTCLCAASLDAETRAASDPSLCGTPCAGNATQICGGDTLLSIYGQITEEVIPQPPAMGGRVADASYTSTVTVCAASLAAQTTATPAAVDESLLSPPPMITGAALPSGNGTIPFVAGSVERKGPGSMMVWGVVAMGIMMVI